MFTAWLSPLHFNVSKHYELIQWFELNRILIVDYFLVYNYSTVEQTDEVLMHDAKEAWEKIIQWGYTKDRSVLSWADDNDKRLPL